MTLSITDSAGLNIHNAKIHTNDQSKTVEMLRAGDRGEDENEMDDGKDDGIIDGIADGMDDGMIDAIADEDTDEDEDQNNKIVFLSCGRCPKSNTIPAGSCFSYVLLFCYKFHLTYPLLQQLPTNGNCVRHMNSGGVPIASTKNEHRRKVGSPYLDSHHHAVNP